MPASARAGVFVRGAVRHRLDFLQLGERLLKFLGLDEVARRCSGLPTSARTCSCAWAEDQPGSPVGVTWAQTPRDRHRDRGQSHRPAKPSDGMRHALLLPGKRAGTTDPAAHLALTLNGCAG